jgi:hypothetical protein
VTRGHVFATRGACVALLIVAATARAQEAAPAKGSAAVSFAFERPGMQVPKFTMRIGEDGAGSYQGEEAAPVSPYPGVSSPPQPIDRRFSVSAATARKVFALAHEINRFNVVCASKAKNIADTGKKTLSYQGSDGEGACTYNYSDNKTVMQLTDIFQGLAATMDEGRQLDHLHRYDRLGLDAALTFFAQQVAEGHALEVGTIESSLRSIAGDTEVMQRARTRATALLAQVPAETTSK